MITQRVIDLSKEYGPTRAKAMKGVKESDNLKLKNEKIGNKCKRNFRLLLEEFVLLLIGRR